MQKERDFLSYKHFNKQTKRKTTARLQVVCEKMSIFLFPSIWTISECKFRNFMIFYLRLEIEKRRSGFRKGEKHTNMFPAEIIWCFLKTRRKSFHCPFSSQSKKFQKETSWFFNNLYRLFGSSIITKEEKLICVPLPF